MRTTKQTTIRTLVQNEPQREKSALTEHLNSVQYFRPRKRCSQHRAGKVEAMSGHEGHNFRAERDEAVALITEGSEESIQRAIHVLLGVHGGMQAACLKGQAAYAKSGYGERPITYDESGRPHRRGPRP